VSLHANGSVVLGSADPHALRSACENIIRNAVRFTPVGSEVQVLFEVDRSTLQPKAIVTVRDHGPGVPEESLQAIFQAFYRINTEAEGPTGNGLGLAIASEAIRLHQGTISAKNLRPTGLEITIQVPIEPEPHFPDRNPILRHYNASQSARRINTIKYRCHLSHLPPLGSCRRLGNRPW
jgi:signal transduction histidine kinase